MHILSHGMVSGLSPNEMITMQMSWNADTDRNTTERYIAIGLVNASSRTTSMVAQTAKPTSSRPYATPGYSL